MDLTEIPANFQWPGANERLTLGQVAMEPVKILRGFSDEEFEIFTYHWVHFYLKSKYVNVQIRTGAGDKGRDIVAWKDEASVSPRRWDLYQCKHYSEKLSPSMVSIELAKVCFYSFRNDYTIPDNYFLVSPLGVGPKLQDFIDVPEKLRKLVIEDWAEKIQSKLTAGKDIPLEGPLKEYVEGFDFSIVRSVEPLMLIEQHQQTPYHEIVFGTRLTKRPVPPAPPTSIQPGETKYVRKLFEVYSDELKLPVNSYNQLASNNRISKHFDYSRKSFHKAAALKEFARDINPNSAFDELTEVIHDGVQSTLFMTHNTPFEKVLNVCAQASNIEIDNNALKPNLLPGDKVGICHHLANEDRIYWIENEDNVE